MLKFKNPFTSQIVDESVDLLSLFPPHSGEITLRYGRIGSGKTYGATKDIIDDLKKYPKA